MTTDMFRVQAPQPTPKQVALFNKLVRERRDSSHWPLADAWVTTASRQDVSTQITRLLAEPKLAPPTPDLAALSQRHDPGVRANPLEPGMYRTSTGQMYRVYPARSASGHLLAKELMQASASDSFYFEYRGLAARFVTAADRMTLEDAKRWGAQYGTCCVCGALLTDPDSVQRGIGPVCGGRV